MENFVKEYVTLPRSHPQFNKYIQGHLQNGLRPIPLRKIAGGEEELTTFGMSPISTASVPTLFKTLFFGIRPDCLPLSMTPAVVTVVYIGLFNGGIAIPHVLLAFFSILFLHGSVFMLNDYYDHLNGIDLARPKERRHHIIRLGWMPPYRVKIWGYAFFGLGSFLGAPLVFSEWQSLIPIAALGAIGVLGYSFKTRGLKYAGYGEIISFLCLGPMLTLGLGICLGQNLKLADLLVVGSLFGCLSFLILHFRHLETLYSDSKSQMSTFVSRMGFDRSKRIGIWGLAALLPIYTLVLNWLAMEGWSLYINLGLVLSTVFFLITIVQKIKSPFSSALKHLYRKVLLLELGVGLLLIIQFLLSHT